MQSLTLNPQAAETNEPLDPAAEVLRLETLLAERQIELTTLQEELLKFKARYTQIVGSRLAELAEVEQAIKAAEARLHIEGDDARCEDDVEGANRAGGKTGAAEKSAMGGSLRKLFWSVAKLFHPDHAADETEARRRHQIMVEASRAYREGDAESLSTLLGDEELQFYCTGTQATDDPEDLTSRLLSLREELRTVEFGIKRLTQDGIYRIKISAEREAAEGRDALAEEAARIQRQIVKARHRLTNLA
jgi:septum formation topological specificity factor MinE